MNRFGLRIWEHLVRTRPGDLSWISDPAIWFEDLGQQIEAEVTTATIAQGTISGQDATMDREVMEATVLARYVVLHPSDMRTDPTDPLPDWLTGHLVMVNGEVTDRQSSTFDPPDMEPTFTAMTPSTVAWLARRSREIVVPVSMLDDPLVRAWRAAGHTITTRAV